MLVLPIKKKWFDMILSGEKKEEYREIKPYYTTRFVNAGFLEHTFNKNCTAPTYNRTVIMFRNGYSSNSPSFTAEVGLRIGTGHSEWGAEPGRKYYVLKILEISDVKNS